MNAEQAGRAARFAFIPIAVSAVLLASPSQVQAQPSLLEFRWAYYAESPVAESRTGPATHAAVDALSAQGILPLLVRGERTFIVPSLSGSWVHVSVRPIDPSEAQPIEHLYDLDLNLTLLRSLSERWRAALVVTPGVASDFHDLEPSHLTLQLSALMRRTVRPELAWGFGASVTNAFGAPLPVPLLALEWTTDRWRVDVLAPARAEIHWTLRERVAVGVSGEVDGNVYTLGRSGELRGAVVRYSVVDVGPTARLALGAGIRLRLSGRASLHRRLEIEDADGDLVQDATLRRGASIELKVSMVAPTDS